MDEKDIDISKSVFLTPPHLPEPVWEAFPAGMKEFTFFGPGEHRLKHEWALEPTCLQEKKASEGKRRGRSPVLHLKKTKGGGSCIFFSSRELQDWGSIREGRGAFISLVEAERIQTIRRAGTKKNYLYYIHREKRYIGDFFLA